MIHLPILRWGQPYKSLESDRVLHFLTGEPVAEVSQATAGIIGRDMRFSHRARSVLREIPSAELVARIERAADLFVGRRPAARRRHAVAGRLRAPAVGDDRPARTPVPVEHGEAAVRPAQHPRHPGRADARPRSRDPREGLWRGERRHAQLPGPFARARPRAARPIRRACTASGCRSSRCRSGWS